MLLKAGENLCARPGLPRRYAPRNDEVRGDLRVALSRQKSNCRLDCHGPAALAMTRVNVNAWDLRSGSVWQGFFHFQSHPLS
jgi:hypothetical protein